MKKETAGNRPPRGKWEFKNSIKTNIELSENILHNVFAELCYMIFEYGFLSIFCYKIIWITLNFSNIRFGLKIIHLSEIQWLASQLTLL